jgi:hypothetical protein
MVPQRTRLFLFFLGCRVLFHEGPTPVCCLQEKRVMRLMLLVDCPPTLYSSTFSLSAASASNRLRFSAASSGEITSTAFDARFRLPDASSASRCCLSAGVSVQSVLSILVSLDEEVAAEKVFLA